MNQDTEVIEIEIDSTLLEAITAIASKEGLTPEEYMSKLAEKFLEENSLSP